MSGVQINLPAGMTEDGLLEVLRDIIGDEEMTDEELRVGFRSGLFQADKDLWDGLLVLYYGAGRENRVPQDKVESGKAVILSSTDSESEEKKNLKMHPDLGTSQSMTSKKKHSEFKGEGSPEKKKKVRLLPPSKYNGAVSKIKLKRWGPVVDKDYLRYQQKFGLKPVSVLCVDLLDLPIVFHPPQERSKNASAVPLASGVHLSNSSLEIIRSQERDKLNWLRKKLNRKFRKSLKISSKGTPVLPWENKTGKKKDNVGKAKVKSIIAKKRIKSEKLKEQVLKKKKEDEQIKNSPIGTFQRILRGIETLNKEHSSKRKVELKIPKKTGDLGAIGAPVPISEYKLDGKVGVGNVCEEVTKLLSANVLVECPVMVESGDSGEYTVKKIAWWFLKNEKEPAAEGVFHPELHDEDDQESENEDEFEWPSGSGSDTGCVSDPEGIASCLLPDPMKIKDPDWADDYCGSASLDAKFRKRILNANEQSLPIDSLEPFKHFLRAKPGTNYDKPNFEVKCFICDEKIKGQRQFGAHIRSATHKNNFRNYSLGLANYEENLGRPEPRKMFVAQLVEYYSTEPSVLAMSTTQSQRSGWTDTKFQIGGGNRARSDSPRPIVAGDAAPNIRVHQMPIPDDVVSLPGMENYDLLPDESLMNVRIVLRTNGKWNRDLERRWRLWKEEETKIYKEYNKEREYFINAPNKHENFKEEWSKFWDRKYLELEAEGKDITNYNLQKEWLHVWMKRMQELIQEKFEKKVAEVKKGLLIDKDTLRLKYNISAVDTNRMKKEILTHEAKKKKKSGADSDNSSTTTSSKSRRSIRRRLKALQEEYKNTRSSSSSERNRDTKKKYLQKSTNVHPGSSHANNKYKDQKRLKRDEKYWYNRNHHQDDRHGKSRGYSSRYDDHNRHKRDYRKDHGRRWDNRRDNRNYGNQRSGGGHDRRNSREFQPKKNNQPIQPPPPQFTSNPTPSPPPLPGPSAVPPPFVGDPRRRPNPTPFVPPNVPCNIYGLPVPDAATPAVTHPASQQYYMNPQNPGNWNGGFGGNQAYGPNNYYNQY